MRKNSRKAIAVVIVVCLMVAVSMILGVISTEVLYSQYKEYEFANEIELWDAEHDAQMSLAEDSVYASTTRRNAQEAADNAAAKSNQNRIDRSDWEEDISSNPVMYWSVIGNGKYAKRRSLASIAVGILGFFAIFMIWFAFAKKRSIFWNIVKIVGVILLVLQYVVYGILAALARVFDIIACGLISASFAVKPRKRHHKTTTKVVKYRRRA